jgi:hypothetical protein
LAASCAKLYPTFKVSANHPIWNAKTLLCQRNLIPSQLPHTQPAVSTSSTFSRYSNRKSNQFSCTMASRHIPLFGVDWYSFFGLSALYQNNPEKMNERSRTQKKFNSLLYVISWHSSIQSLLLNSQIKHIRNREMIVSVIACTICHPITIEQ